MCNVQIINQEESDTLGQVSKPKRNGMMAVMVRAAERRKVEMSKNNCINASFTLGGHVGCTMYLYV